MGEIFGALGSVASAAISADAIKDATAAQIKALEKQRAFVFKELDPAKLSALATAADVEQARNKLALQGLIDPALLRSRYAAEAGIENQLAGLTSGAGDVVAQRAAAEALTAGGDFDTLKKRLIDTALGELEAGASLPSDLQAELVKAGLERGSAVTGSANPRGIAGQESRRLIGQAGLELQANRQTRAAALGEAAQNLEAKRASILGSLFPALKQTQLGNLAAIQGVLGTSEAFVPEAGLGGGDIADLYAARVGATTNLAQAAADARARQGMSLAQVLNQGIGGATAALGSALPSTSSIYNKIFGGGSFSNPQF